MNDEKQRMDSLTDQAGEIFCNALEIGSADEQARYVEEACAGDDGLRAAVRQLLKAHEGAEKLFQSGCPTQVSATEFTQSLSSDPAFRKATEMVLPPERELGECIGPYRLVQKIGEGGGGCVYLAEQEHPVKRQVALKVLRLGTDTKSVIARFESERQVLALMEHPNIARVLDAGETKRGLPFFVMELVHGVRITEYCDTNRLDIRQRQELFIQVCHAIQHAHHKGIIHRDIKPSNVLITMHDGLPVPKVIDFGIAKAISGPLSDEHTVQTMCEQFVGTPAYMSPEQAGLAEEDIDVRSDIYSLGVLLYELLVGKPPFRKKELLGSGLNEMLRTLREREPLRPSDRLQALGPRELPEITRCRRIESRRLHAMLSGDLDWIVMKALEKDRDRRYRTADSLADDVLHYLNDEPVVARPPSRRYRFQKLVRRNKGVFASVGAIGLTLIAGLGTSSWLFIREREALREVERARQNEAELRLEAEVREKITQAAVLLRHRKPAEADELVGSCRIPVIKPSLEATDVFRKLGNWNVTQGRWPQAADRLLKMARASRVDKTDMTDGATRDLLLVGPALIAAEEFENYYRFRQETISHFAGSKNPVAAEQVIKLSTIIPTDVAVRKSLEPLADVLEASIVEHHPKSKSEIYMTAWRVLALSLYEYRRGDFNAAADWSQKGLDSADATPTRIAMSHIVLAMACSQLDQAEAAHHHLSRGRKLVDAKFPAGLAATRGLHKDATGFWNDWVMAYLLLDEAKGLILQMPADSE